MPFTFSGFGHVVLEIADEIDPGLDLATVEARIGIEAVEKGAAIEKEIVEDLKAVVKKHFGHFAGLSFSGQHVGVVDIKAAVAPVTAAESPTDGSGAAIPEGATPAVSGAAPVTAPALTLDPPAQTPNDVAAAAPLASTSEASPEASGPVASDDTAAGNTDTTVA